MISNCLPLLKFYKMRFLLFAIFSMVLFSCGSTKSADSEQIIPTGFDGKLMVTLLKDKKAHDLEVKYAKYNLKHKAIASKVENRHMFTYDTSTIGAKSILKKLNKHKDVYYAESLASQLKNPSKKVAPPSNVQDK